MKPVVIYARSLFEVVAQIRAIRRAARAAIAQSGAVRITVEPVAPDAITTAPPAKAPIPTHQLIAAREIA